MVDISVRTYDIHFRRLIALRAECLQWRKVFDALVDSCFAICTVPDWLVVLHRYLTPYPESRVVKDCISVSVQAEDRGLRRGGNQGTSRNRRCDDVVLQVVAPVLVFELRVAVFLDLLSFQLLALLIGKRRVFE